MRTKALLALLLPLILGTTRGAESYPATTGIPINLWPEGIPGYRADGPPEKVMVFTAADKVKPGRFIYHVRHPTLVAYLPPAGTACGTAIIFCPGGGYIRLPAETTENTEARWLNHLGVAVFVLTYRFGDDGPNAPLRDVLRAIRLVRSHAADYGVKPDCIGVMGGSAGGHLAANASTLYDDPDGKTGAPLDAVSGRPDFAIMLYPAISLRPPYALHPHEGLLGPNGTPEQMNHFSSELHVTKDTSPAFIVTTQGDKSVPLANSIIYYEALNQAGVPAELHIFEKGAHGFGMESGLGPTSEWPARCEDWLRFHGWIGPAAKS
jgi:acetyl esterase/lipase